MFKYRITIRLILFSFVIVNQNTRKDSRGNGGNRYRNGVDHNNKIPVSIKGINTIPYYLRGNTYEKF